ncbi:MAG: DUF2769 domain-containing protein [Methanobacteriaceae archaeon]|nr:DUF2769 domain-containing protein [Methanobacteriaceae archaeon]
MDAFEELMEKLNNLNDEERANKIRELEADCVCPTCPTYNDCAKEKGENIFCITGKSQECITMTLGCLCPTCPLAQKYEIGLTYNFYCNNGSETEQRG